MMPGSSEADRYDAIVVGAGFAGMYMLHKLRGLGMRVRAFDAASDVGGTWYWNRYPGARCDVVSVDYSFSFSDELQQEWTWTEKYAAQPEILAYANFVADRLDLRRDMQFHTRVTEMVFDEDAVLWNLKTEAGESYVARFCVMATGCLSMPKAPDVPGLLDFQGPVYFTSSWPHEDVDFSGKTVGLIGTGSSGIQVMPQVAGQAERLYVFQRNPSFTLPARNGDLAEGFLEGVKAQYPERRALARRHPAGHLRPLTNRKTLSIEEDERRTRFDKAWTTGGLDLFGEFGDLLVDEAANVEVARLIYEKIDALVDDPRVADALKPRNTPFGGRRVCLDTDYYATFNRDNVELVDVLSDPIDRVVAKGMKTRDRLYELDVFVLAVGFDAMTGALLSIDIRGRDGRSLRDKWASGPASYLGVAIEGFPNLFTITGPGSPSVLANVVAAIEQHVEWIADLLKHLQASKRTEVEALADAELDWVRQTYDLAKDTLLMKANSWYLGANVPGKPRVFMPYAGGLDRYRDICADIAADGYRGFAFDGASVREEPAARRAANA